MSFKKTAACAAVMLASMGAGSAMAADEGPWLVRARIAELTMDNKSDPVGGTGASDRIHVNNKTIPDVDISYFWNKNIATEMLLTIPQKQDVTLDGTKIGTFKHLPPTLLVQYHFLPDGDVRPYVGVGINYTIISSVNLAGGTLALDHSSVGPAAQAGVDIKLTPNVFLNFDLKYIQIRSDVKAGGTKVSAVKLDPVVPAIGLGNRF